MNQIVGVSVALLLLSVSALYAECEIDPFPPYPPSPPEFQKPLALSAISDGILAQWEIVPDQEGYFVSICSGQSGYKPVSVDVAGEQLLIENPGPAGTYFVQVKAFVKVSESYVFNGGVIGQLNWAGSQSAQVKSNTLDESKGSEGQDSDKASISANVERADASKLDILVSSLPGFNPSQSFYNADYPGVSNPFISEPTPDGRMAPALITDEGITQTVNRVSKKWDGRRPQLNRKVDLPVQVAKASQSGPQNGLEAAGSKNSSQGQYEKSNVGSTRDVKNLGTPQKAIDKIPTQGVKVQQEAESSEIPENKNPDLLIYLITGFLVLAIIYFIFHKETK